MDLLVNPFRSIYAIDCEIEDGVLTCGALYLEANQQHEIIRLADNAATLDVRLPPELLGQPDAQRAWDVELPIVSPS